MTVSFLNLYTWLDIIILSSHWHCVTSVVVLALSKFWQPIQCEICGSCSSPCKDYCCLPACDIMLSGGRNLLMFWWALKMETRGSSEMSLSSYQTAWCHIPPDSNFTVAMIIHCEEYKLSLSVRAHACVFCIGGRLWRKFLRNILWPENFLDFVFPSWRTHIILLLILLLHSVYV
jgi:hypothetical protein